MIDLFDYIEVAVAFPVYKTYTYSVAENFSTPPTPGKRVLVPFGKRRLTGYIIGPAENPKKKIKPVIDILDEIPIFSETMVPFFRWISDYYKYPIGEVIKSALPGGLNINELTQISITRKGEKIFSKDTADTVESEILSRLHKKPCYLKDLCKSFKKNMHSSVFHKMEQSGWIIQEKKLKSGRTRYKMDRYLKLNPASPPAGKLSGSKKKIIDILKSKSEDISSIELNYLVSGASRLTKSMERDGYILIFKKKIYRDPFGESIAPDTIPLPTREQEEAIKKVSASCKKGFAAFLLSGVTGSGKTEVYMQLAAGVIESARSVLVLVPEIALISQIERRFRARFGERVAVLHSGLTAGEYYDQWMRIVRNEVVIVIGARSAVFAPFADIGLIIVDEEHDSSYKQDRGLHYNARDMAVVRAKLNSGVVLLGSATPSIQSYYNVVTGKFFGVSLKERVLSRSLPEVSVVDLRKRRDDKGIKRFITKELFIAMKKTLERGEQILLFLNRRGFAGYSVCAACGSAVKCKNCDISLTLHQAANAFKCHFCGYSRSAALKCSTCGSSNIYSLGVGTEKIAEAVKNIFPNAHVARMDRDTIKKKGSILKILKGLKNKTIDILVGTQMIAKGHDYNNITLVGIICADLGLNFPDFRAGEYTFQTLAQVAGRAGRGVAPGKVILQTYNPEHFSILSAKDHDFLSFYNKEANFRKILKYPPFSRMIQIKISGKDKKKTEQLARNMCKTCNDLTKNDRYFSQNVEIMGPIEAFISRVANKYRWQILLKSPNTAPLHKLVEKLMHENSGMFNKRNIHVIVDVDPVFMM